MWDLSQWMGERGVVPKKCKKVKSNGEIKVEKLFLHSSLMSIVFTKFAALRYHKYRLLKCLQKLILAAK